MRLSFVFLLLLVIASTSVSVVWQTFESMLSADASAGIVVTAGVTIGLVSSALLGRIVLKVSAVKRAEKET